MSLRARLTFFFISIVVVPFVVAGVLVRSAISHEVDRRTEIRLEGNAQALGLARLVLGQGVAERARAAAAQSAEMIPTGGSSSPRGGMQARLDRIRAANELDFLVVAAPNGSGLPPEFGSLDHGRFLDRSIDFTAPTIVRPGALAPLLISVPVPVERDGALIATIHAGIYLDQSGAEDVSMLARGAPFEISIGGRLAVSSLNPPIPLPAPRSGSFDLPGDFRGSFVPLPAPRGAVMAVIAPLEGDVAYLRAAILLVLIGTVLMATALGYGLARVVAEPIRRLADQAAAALARGSNDRPPDARPGDEVRSLATTLSAMTENLQEAERLSMTDPLTGIGNRRFLAITMGREVERARRFGRGLSVLMVDVDRFKTINDEEGHERGDRVLVDIADRIGTSMRREIDTVVRFGGEEFVVLLPETGPAGARAVAQRIRRAVASKPFGGVFGAEFRVTVSVGGASFPEHGNNAEDLIRVADEAMYRAKTLGRDRVEMAKRARAVRSRPDPVDPTAPGIDS